MRQKWPVVLFHSRQEPIRTNSIVSLQPSLPKTAKSSIVFPVQPWFGSCATSSFRTVKLTFPQHKVCVCGFKRDEQSVQSHENTTLKEAGTDDDLSHEHIAGADIPLQKWGTNSETRDEWGWGRGFYIKYMCWNKWGKSQTLKVPEGKKKGSKSNTEQGSHNSRRTHRPSWRLQNSEDGEIYLCRSV